MIAVARWLRCTEGQAWSLLLGLLVAMALAIGGIPAVLRTQPAQRSPAVPSTVLSTGARP
jgi:hypothetical protein